MRIVIDITDPEESGAGVAGWELRDILRSVADGASTGRDEETFAMYGLAVTWRSEGLDMMR